MYGHTITIINSINERGRLTYYTHTIKGVHYQDKQGVKTGTENHVTDNQGYVSIPRSVKGYVTEEEYVKLIDKVGYWTLKEDDFIVKGDVLNAIPEKTAGKRTIQSYENIDYGIVIEGHYGVYLK
ncbi:hypothetical protein [Pseudomonas sp.]|uniref:hypothetical protein n=1 Tax=Pseudomonas sp. TaxID=306 RepID=UPI00261AE3EA|nr:hypothetical protein [Pseudomonas sp.]